MEGDGPEAELRIEGTDLPETVKARWVSYEGLFRVGVPLGWDVDVEDEVFSFRSVDEDGWLQSAIDISVTWYEAQGAPTEADARAFLTNFVGITGWDDVEAWIETVPIPAGPAATLTYTQQPDQPFGSLSPAPGYPVLWQMWIVMAPSRFALITQQIQSDSDEAEYFWLLGQRILEQTFQWLDE